MKQDIMGGNQSLVSMPGEQTSQVEIPNALPIRLQVLDFARHVVIAPDEERFVVATYDDSRLGRGIITAIYPQLNKYLTLVRLTIKEFSSATPEEAIKRHVAVCQAIQQGKINEFRNALQGNMNIR